MAAAAKSNNVINPGYLYKPRHAGHIRFGNNVKMSNGGKKLVATRKNRWMNYVAKKASETRNAARSGEASNYYGPPKNMNSAVMRAKKLHGSLLSEYSDDEIIKARELAAFKKIGSDPRFSDKIIMNARVIDAGYMPSKTHSGPSRRGRAKIRLTLPSGNENVDMPISQEEEDYELMKLKEMRNEKNAEERKEAMNEATLYLNDSNESGGAGAGAGAGAVARKTRRRRFN